MKKLTLVLGVILLFGCSQPVETISQERTVLLEQFTGTWCGWCPYGADILRELVKKYDTKLVVLAYHDKDEMATEAGDTYKAVVKPNYPMAAIDRLQYPETTRIPVGRGDWERTVQYRLGARSLLKFELDASYNSSTRNVNLKVNMKSLRDLGENTKINVIIAEDGLVYEQKKFRPTEMLKDYVHYNVVREMVTGPFGESIKINPPTETETVDTNKEFEFPISRDYNTDNCRIVIFVHKDVENGVGPVIQAAEISIKDMVKANNN